MCIVFTLKLHYQLNIAKLPPRVGVVDRKDCPLGGEVDTRKVKNVKSPMVCPAPYPGAKL